jgi:hypothetical protein
VGLERPIERAYSLLALYCLYTIVMMNGLGLFLLRLEHGVWALWAARLVASWKQGLEGIVMIGCAREWMRVYIIRGMKIFMTIVTLLLSYFSRGHCMRLPVSSISTWPVRGRGQMVREIFQQSPRFHPRNPPRYYCCLGLVGLTVSRSHSLTFGYIDWESFSGGTYVAPWSEV